MKKIKLYLILLLPFFSCEKNLPKQDKVSKSESKTISGEKISETNDERTWKEYKRRPVNSITDEIPYNGCFFKIKNKKFYYYKDSKLLYIDDFLYDKSLNRTLFKNHYMDEIIFNSDSTDVVLKRDNYEGEYEYFRKK